MPSPKADADLTRMSGWFEGADFGPLSPAGQPRRILMGVVVRKEGKLQFASTFEALLAMQLLIGRWSK